jgi:hypothetical protein
MFSFFADTHLEKFREDRSNNNVDSKYAVLRATQTHIAAGQRTNQDYSAVNFPYATLKVMAHGTVWGKKDSLKRQREKKGKNHVGSGKFHCKYPMVLQHTLQRRDFILTKRCTPSVQKMSFFNKRCFII